MVTQPPAGLGRCVPTLEERLDPEGLRRSALPQVGPIPALVWGQQSGFPLAGGTGATWLWLWHLALSKANTGYRRVAGSGSDAEPWTLTAEAAVEEVEAGLPGGGAGG